jgi:O-antigen ligase
VYLTYQYLGGPVGASVPLLGFATLGLLAVYCLINDSRRPIRAYWPLRYAFACGITYLVAQVLVHGAALGDDYVRDFGGWLLMLVVVHALCRREGFLTRFALVAILIGVATLPFLAFSSEGRAQLDRSAEVGGLANSNALAEWFGFCCICFVVVGIETTRHSVRALSWSIATACLLVVGLTVSRGTLLSLAVAITIACRRVLRRGFVPLLALLLLAWVAFAGGLFDNVAASFADRATQETGRFLVWPLAIQRWMAAPFTGVGAAGVATWVPAANKPITPHNGFIFMGLAAGLIPFVFFVLYWMQAVRAAIRSTSNHVRDAPFHLPLIAYAFLTNQFGGVTFMTSWMVVTLTTVIAAGAIREEQRFGTRPLERRMPAGNGRLRAMGYRFHGS